MIRQPRVNLKEFGFILSMKRNLPSWKDMFSKANNKIAAVYVALLCPRLNYDVIQCNTM